MRWIATTSARRPSYTRMAINFKQTRGRKSIFATEITHNSSYSLYEIQSILTIKVGIFSAKHPVARTITPKSEERIRVSEKPFSSAVSSHLSQVRFGCHAHFKVILLLDVSGLT